MGEFCPREGCNEVMQEHFTKFKEKDIQPRIQGMPTPWTLISQGYWCPRCRKWYEWKKVKSLVEKK